MLTISQWSPLLVGLAAPLLAWLLVTSRTSPRRAAVRVSIVAALSVLVSLPLRVFDLQFLLHGPPNHDFNLEIVVRAADNLFGALAWVLALAAWVLLLTAAAQAGGSQRLIVLTAVLAVALAFQALLYFRSTESVIQLEESLDSSTWGLLLYGVLQNVAAVAALACTFFLPVEPTTPAVVPTAASPE